MGNIKIEAKGPKDVAQSSHGAAWPQHVLFARSAPGTRFGVVIDSEPSSLALLAAGVAGIAARRARRSGRMNSLESHKTAT